MREALYSKGIGWIFIILGGGGSVITLFYDVIVKRPSIVIGIMAKLGLLFCAGLFILGVDYLIFWNKKRRGQG